ncbi:MAG: hypothetical protein JJU00_01080 [Opitutales bacterium]|nr:hypothetical protein [Opitutales bacterium]
MNLSKWICLTPAAVLLSLTPLGATVLVIDEDFTTNTTGNWSFTGESTLDGGEYGNLDYRAATSGDDWGFGPHDGAMRWRPEHTGISSDQATLIYQISGVTENASGYTLETTGIHAGNQFTDIYLAIRYEDGSSQWAVSDQSIRTSSGNSAPVPGSWDLSTLTFSSLDYTNLVAGGGSSVSSSTVLENVSGIGIFSIFEDRNWMADNGTYVDSFTVIPEPRIYAAILGLTALGLILWRRRG